ncbi:MAG: hypothetical protein ACRCW2_06735, partial [Cellulosilyticaceae bacterium]
MKCKPLRFGSFALLLVVSMLLVAQPLLANDGTLQWTKDAMVPWNPNQKITKGEFAQIFTYVFGLTTTKNAKTYEDIPANYMYGEAIKKISHKEWVRYTSKKFGPSTLVTRDEVNYAFEKAMGQSSKLLVGDPKGSVTKSELAQALSKQFVSLIRKPGVYSKNIKGNVAINTTKVTLKDMKIEGNLYILEGAGDSYEPIILDNVKVTGATYTYNWSTGHLSVQGDTVLGQIKMREAATLPTHSNYIKFVNKDSHRQLDSRTITITSPKGELKRDTGSNGSILVSERDGFKVGDVVKVSIQADGRTQTFEYQLKSGMSVQTPALVEEVAYK